MKNNEEYEYAGFWVRVWASLIDFAIMMPIILYILFQVYYGSYNDYDLNIQSMNLAHTNVLEYTYINYNIYDSWLNGIKNIDLTFILIKNVLPFIIVMIFWYYKSATPGKLVFGMQIVDAKSGDKMSNTQLIGRYFAYIPAIMFFFLGILWVGIDRKKQGWHDKLAQTVVIIKKKRVDEVEFEKSDI